MYRNYIFVSILRRRAQESRVPIIRTGSAKAPAAKKGCSQTREHPDAVDYQALRTSSDAPGASVYWGDWYQLSKADFL